jgi:hypothetical protein
MALLKGKLFAGALFAGALLGAAPEQPPVTPPVAEAPSQRFAGSGIYRSGTGYVWKDDAWVQVQKGAWYFVSSPSEFEITTRAGASGAGSTFKVTEKEVETHVVAGVQSPPNSFVAVSRDGGTGSHATEETTSDTLLVATAEGGVEWLSIDELLIVLETLDG